MRLQVEHCLKLLAEKAEPGSLAGLLSVLDSCCEAELQYDVDYIRPYLASVLGERSGAVAT